MIKDVGQFFRCFSVIQYSSVENSLFSSVSHFLTGLFCSLESNFLSFLCILNISPLLDLGLVKILSQSVGGLFVLLTVSFALQKLCNCMRSYLSILLDHYSDPDLTLVPGICLENCLFYAGFPFC